MKYETLEQTTSYWVGQDKYRRYNIEESWQEAQSNSRTRPGWTYSRGAPRNSRSRLYKVYINVIHMKRKSCLIHLLLVFNYLSNYVFLVQCSSFYA